MSCEKETEDNCCKKDACCEFPDIHGKIIANMDCCEIHTEKFEHSAPFLPFVKDSKVKLYSQFYSNYTAILKHSDRSEINSYQYHIHFLVKDVCTLNSSFRV